MIIMDNGYCAFKGWCFQDSKYRGSENLFFYFMMVMGKSEVFRWLWSKNGRAWRKCQAVCLWDRLGNVPQYALYGQNAWSHQFYILIIMNFFCIGRNGFNFLLRLYPHLIIFFVLVSARCNDSTDFRFLFRSFLYM